jgi:lysophospholipase L1-like esterase
MKSSLSFRATALVAGLSVVTLVPVSAETPTTTKPTPSPAPTAPAAPKKPVSNDKEPGDQAAPKKDAEGAIFASFQKAHENFLARGKQPVGLLFLGDSITAGWGGRGKKVWDENYAKYEPANFGIGGDRTQHVLWRIENGELDGIKPKVLVLMIGTNNIAYTPENIIKGDLKIVSEIHAKLPQTKLLLLGIFPRGAEANNPFRDKIKTVNQALAKLDDGKMTRYLDIGAKFLDEAGNIPKEIMPDALHPNEKGYEIWAAAIQPLLEEMLK